MSEKPHANAAIFVPHIGCPCQCSFCDQRLISGQVKAPTPEETREFAARAAREMPQRLKPAQIAFFGGSFTNMNREYMVSLLQSVQEYVNGDIYTGIRISTRPDAVSEDILDILQQYRVTDIELGAQSMDDRVLDMNKRGHTAKDTENAAKLIKSRSLGLGLQMMTGLYGDSGESSRQTADKLIALKPDCVRIYPTMVLRATMLAELCEKGVYRPQTLDEAAELCSELLEKFTENGIPVIRMGLHDSSSVRENMLAGPYHPAFRELCENRILMRKVLEQIRKNRIEKGKIVLAVKSSSFSKMAGHKRANLLRLEDMGFKAKIIPDESLRYLQVRVSRDF